MGRQLSLLVHQDTLLFPLHLNDLSDWNAVLYLASVIEIIASKKISQFLAKQVVKMEDVT